MWTLFRHTYAVALFRYTGVPFFWTQQYGKSLRYAGHAHTFDAIVTHGTMEGDKPAFTVFYTHGQTVRSSAACVLPCFCLTANKLS